MLKHLTLTLLQAGVTAGVVAGASGLPFSAAAQDYARSYRDEPRRHESRESYRASGGRYGYDRQSPSSQRPPYGERYGYTGFGRRVAPWEYQAAGCDCHGGGGRAVVAGGYASSSRYWTAQPSDHYGRSQHGEPARYVQSPPVYVSAPPVYVQPPEVRFAPPTVYVAPPVYVRQPPIYVQSPPVYVEGPEVIVAPPHVEVAPPRIVSAPPVHVRSPPVYVEGPQVHIAPPAVEIGAPTVINAPPVQVEAPAAATQTPGMEYYGDEPPPGNIPPAAPPVRHDYRQEPGERG